VAVIVVMILAPSALAQRMDVPAWKQADPRWAGLHLGGSSYTMSRSGCAVTACAMVAAYFGSEKSPGALCRALSANGGLTSSGDLYWQKVPAAGGGTIKYVARYDYCSLKRINQELDSGYPVIVKVHRRGNTHFVVLTGRSGPTYYINDPAGGVRTTLNEQYGNPGTVIHGFRVYRGTQTSAAPSSSLTRYQQANIGLDYDGSWIVSSSDAASRQLPLR
jgi:ABC-type bacteriocin/lantibiotic exporter with double-glycine peptidase domain